METLKMLEGFFPCLIEHPLAFIATLLYLVAFFMGIKIAIDFVRSFILVPKKEKEDASNHYDSIFMK